LIAQQLRGEIEEMYAVQEPSSVVGRRSFAAS